MQAVVFHKPGDIRVHQIDDPKIENPEDIVLRVTCTAICGSDLHIYNGLIPQAGPMVMGHEFMGIVEETGGEVRAVKTGDRVVVPFPIACGGCFFCQRGLPGHCENSNRRKYGPEGGLLDEKGGGLFGDYKIRPPSIPSRLLIVNRSHGRGWPEKWNRVQIMVRKVIGAPVV
jgi:S-(hydroxymethyl)glutathione dehydrogenase / alcohol dehydrogenase